MRMALLAVLGVLAACVTAPISDRVAYVNGQIFDGAQFVPGAMVVQDGRFVHAEVSSASQQIDLDGGYVTPPFCEAHNHLLGSSYRNEENIARYLLEGIFYVGNLSNVPLFTEEVRDTYNKPDSVDVIFGNGGLTATGGHPVRLREFLLERGVYPGFTRETLADHAYFIIDNEEDLARRWPTILGFQPDFIKIFLLNSEEFEERRDDPAFFGTRGLDPAIVPSIVERAHAAQLRAFAHVETGHDFHVALTSGVDVIAHLPGYGRPSRIDPADAHLAAERGVPVMTTAMLMNAPRRRGDPELNVALRRGQIENLQTLRAAGVTLAAGSDQFDATSSAEIAHLRALNVFSDVELLRMWSTDCVRTLFPDRQVGRLEPGYEASFLVLGGNPLADFSAVREIRLRVKDGTPMQAGQAVME